MEQLEPLSVATIKINPPTYRITIRGEKIASLDVGKNSDPFFQIRHTPPNVPLLISNG